MVSGSISLLCSRFFSPFPHGTGSLSVSGEYLALADGPAWFTQGFSCPALLRILIGLIKKSCTGLSPSMIVLSKTFHFSNFYAISQSYNPSIAETMMVWAVPISLAATLGITFVLYSYGYLDVSVPHVRLSLLARWYNLLVSGCPIRIPADRFVFANPRSFSQLITSFIAFQSLGILHVPLFTFFSRLFDYFRPFVNVINNKYSLQK